MAQAISSRAQGIMNTECEAIRWKTQVRQRLEALTRQRPVANREFVARVEEQNNGKEYDQP